MLDLGLSILVWLLVILFGTWVMFGLLFFAAFLVSAVLRSQDYKKARRLHQEGRRDRAYTTNPGFYSSRFTDDKHNDHN